MNTSYESLQLRREAESEKRFYAKVSEPAGELNAEQNNPNVISIWSAPSLRTCLACTALKEGVIDLFAVDLTLVRPYALRQDFDWLQGTPEK